MIPKKVAGMVHSRLYLLGLLVVSNIVLGYSHNETGSLRFQQLTTENQWKNKVPVIYDSAGLDGELQSELAKSTFVALNVLEKGNLQPLFLDLSKFGSVAKIHAMQKCAKILLTNELNVVVSLLYSDELRKFVDVYDKIATKIMETSSGKQELHMYTPRAYPSSWKVPRSVSLKSLQMSEEAKAKALLNRVEKVGVRTLIPVLDGDVPSQVELLKAYYALGKESKQMVKFTKPILLNDPVHANKLKDILHESTGFHENHLRIHDQGQTAVGRNETVKDLKLGILLLAVKGCRATLKIAAEKNHVLLSWFSPDIFEIEESLQKQPTSVNGTSYRDANRIDHLKVGLGNEGQHNNDADGTIANNSLFGMYTLSFAGSKGWDNPVRRRMLREFTAFTGATPMILTAVLAYDAMSLARDHLRNEMQFPKPGLSGLIEFSKSGFRNEGTYLGISSVPQLQSSVVTLLQPSTWVLEDVISLKEDYGKVPYIVDYDIATSSILPNAELRRIANTTRNGTGCKEHLMNVVTYDPFNQMPYNYFFSEANLPETIVVPNQQGFGITFVCTHDAADNGNATSSNYTNVKSEKDDGHSLLSTLQLACTPGLRLNHPINCFRSRLNKRQRRDTADKKNSVPNVQYQYSFSSKDPWLSQNSQWATSKDDTASQYYYQPIKNRDYQLDPVTYGYPTTRLDIPISEEPSSTPAPANAPGTSKLPELRQILKAAKPFVGSCIGSSTGCAMCVLVLGRLPLGALPAACTGPCFVGTFGSCGSLLGRVFSETTVICTELFRQGYIDPETFAADAEFGKYVTDSSPYTMKGYTLLATPLVELMKSSEIVTNIVATFALPWAHHMKYLLGRSDEPNLTGKFVHVIGYPICNIAGRAQAVFSNLRDYYLTYGIVLFSPLLTSLMTLAAIFMLIPNLGFSTSTQRYNIFQLVIILYLMTRKSKQLIQTRINYFKAIGRRT